MMKILFYALTALLIQTNSANATNAARFRCPKPAPYLDGTVHLNSVIAPPGWAVVPGSQKPYVARVEFAGLELTLARGSSEIMVECHYKFPEGDFKITQPLPKTMDEFTLWPWQEKNCGALSGMFLGVANGCRLSVRKLLDSHPFPLSCLGDIKTICDFN